MKTISIASGWTYAVRKKRGAPEFELRRIGDQQGGPAMGFARGRQSLGVCDPDRSPRSSASAGRRTRRAYQGIL
jgi:hypothetical protein